MKHEELRRDAVVVPVALALVRAAVVRRIEDPDACLDAIRRQFARQAGELADDLAGDDRPGEGYLAKAGRLTAARHQAEEIIRHEYGPPTPEDTAALAFSGRLGRVGAHHGRRKRHRI